jgi:hypothetical protein
VLAAPWFVPAAALGYHEKPAPSERITLGVIGIGPRCTYDLKAMLPFPDVRCLAIADVQAKRREAGKTLVDQHYGTRTAFCTATSVNCSTARISTPC